MELLPFVWGFLAILDTLGCLNYRLVLLIWGCLGKLVPNSVKQRYFQQVKPRSQYIQGCLGKLVPYSVKQIEQVEPRSQYIQGCPDKLVPNNAKEMKLPMVTPRSQYIQESVCSVFQKLKWSKAIRIYIKVHGNDMNCHKDFLKSLGFSSNDAVTSVDQSDVLIAFVPIVSRIKTDIEAALKHIPEHRRTVLVLLHYTFDPDVMIPESRQTVCRSNIFAVDCLFHEDLGLLECPRNKKALEATAKYLQDVENNYQFTF